MKWITIFLVLLFGLVLISCQASDEALALEIETTSEEVDDTEETEQNNTPVPRNIKLLALGDSYTIGQSVCETCRFPEQLKDSIITYANENDTFQLDILAQTGWTTTDLLDAISESNLESQYNLVTLLIGVNNQYQGKPFDLYTSEFPQLVNKALSLLNNDYNNIIIVSIPDYAYTPFGLIFDDGTISNEIDTYNAFAETYAQENGITFVNITDITRMGLENPELVAIDGLHPSELAYSRFVERLLPFALEKLEIGN